ncbi:2-keto-4-pentenoate hydratase [Brachybacterium huguangmaarense]
MSVPTTGRALSDEQVVAIADELAEATRTGGTIPLVSPRHAGMTVEDSYAIQRVWRARREEAGGRVVGHKIGLTSKAMQDATGIDEPDYGVIFADQVIASGETVEHARWSNVRVEVELAFVLRERLAGPGVTREQVLAATEAIVPALEILDSHIELAGRTIVDTISDNAALGAMVLGTARLAPDAEDLSWIGAMCRVDGEVMETGVAGGVLGDPVMGVVWLADKLGEHGDALEAGETVLAGSFTRPVWVRPGSVVSVDYHGREDIETLEVTFR